MKPTPFPMIMLRTTPISPYRLRRAQPRHRRRQRVAREVHEWRVELVELVHEVSMVLHRNELGRIDRQRPQPRPISRTTMSIKIITLTTVRNRCARTASSTNHSVLSLQTTTKRVKKATERHGITIRKVSGKRNRMAHWVSTRMKSPAKEQVSRSPRPHPHARRSLAAGSDTTGAMNPQESSMKRDVHNFIFDDETVVVDDCSFVLPYIEGAYYYQSTTPPPATDLPLSSIDTNTDEYTIPLVPAYTEQQLKELLRRQV